MKRWFVGLVAGLGAALITGAAFAADLSLYGRLPTIEDISLSPDGKRIAMIRTDGEKRRVYIQDLAGGKVLAAADAGTAKVRYIQWATPSHLLIVVTTTTNLSQANVSANRGDYATGVLLSAEDGKQKQVSLMAGNAKTLNIIQSAVTRQVDNEVSFFVTGISFNAQGQGVNTVFRVNPSTGASRIISQGDPGVHQMLLGPDGLPAAAVQSRSGSDLDTLLIRGPRGLQPVSLPQGATRGPSVVGFSPDGVSVVVSYQAGDRRVLAEVSKEGTWKPLDDDADGSGALVDSTNDRVVAWTTRQGDQKVYRFANAQDQRVWNAIEKAYPGERLSLISTSADHKRIIILADSPKAGETYSLVDVATGAGQILGDARQGLKPSNISPVRAISYKAADGLTITGYLTLPQSVGPSPKRLPLIVLPHGGPASRDVAGFDWWAQAMAAQGYAVLQPNFRGSAGLGVSFMEAGFGEWGRKMQTDLSDGVRHLAADGLIDPARVCIVGASYGGYAALAGAAIDKGVYRCAVSVAGPSDLRRMLISERYDGGPDGAFRYWKRFMGVNGVDDPKLAAISPAARAGEVAVPVLIIHGKDDTVVPYEQSQIMADALKKAGKPVEFVTLDGEDHWLSRGATRLKMLQAIAAFVEKNNPPG